MISVICLAVLVGYALYAMTPEERIRAGKSVLRAARRAKDAAADAHARPEPFRDALRERTPLVIVTPALVALNVAVYLGLLFGRGAIGDPQTLIEWGGSIGPRTTNGQWWRLAASTFVHPGLVPLAVNVAGLLQVGMILERLVGRAALTGVYLAAGVFGSLVHLYSWPMVVGVGASSAVFGVYGLLAASAIWGFLQRQREEPQGGLGLSEAAVTEPAPAAGPRVTVSLEAIRRTSPPVAVFILYHAATTGLGAGADATGFGVGLACGLVLANGVRDRKAPVRRVGVAVAATAAIALAAAVPLRGVADVRPELERIVALEEQTAKTYQGAVDRFKRGRLKADALALVIDRTIVPELQATRARLEDVNMDKVPDEHKPLVAAAQEYFRLRDESWRLRSRGLQRGNLGTLRDAEKAEYASLEALRQIKPAPPQ